VVAIGILDLACGCHRDEECREGIERIIVAILGAAARVRDWSYSGVLMARTAGWQHLLSRGTVGEYDIEGRCGLQGEGEAFMQEQVRKVCPPSCFAIQQVA
jgi:hypothetical protein